MELPEGFKKMIRGLIDDEAESLFSALNESPVTGVRYNPRKLNFPFESSTAIPWCENGRILAERPSFTQDPLFHAGTYYVQDPSSMFYSYLLTRIVDKLDKNSEAGGNPLVLDMCAAPGGKTTAMIDALPENALVVANEFVRQRACILVENLSKWGFRNVIITNRDTSFFKKFQGFFDIVAVDAPCSGEGMMRKEEKAREQWNEKLIESCSLLQKEILDNAGVALAPGGYLIYSTCTFNRKENEENVSYIVEELGLEPIDLHLPSDWNISKGMETKYPCYRFFPHKISGEGLFVALFKKPDSEEWMRIALRDKDKVLKSLGEENLLNRTFSPTIKKSTGEYKKVSWKKDMSKKSNGTSDKNELEEPSIREVLSVDFDRSRYPEYEMSLDEALKFLRRESLVLPAYVEKGFVVVTYRGVPLGCVKNIGSRANNLYPKSWRILK